MTIEIPGVEEVTAALVEILDECGRRGMVPPFIVVSGSRNGSVVAMRVRGDGSKTELLAEHFEDDILLAPVTCMVLDQQNEAVHITIGPGEVTIH